MSLDQPSEGCIHSSLTSMLNLKAEHKLIHRLTQIQAAALVSAMKSKILLALPHNLRPNHWSTLNIQIFVAMFDWQYIQLYLAFVSHLFYFCLAILQCICALFAHLIPIKAQSKRFVITIFGNRNFWAPRQVDSN
jgi:hypothetical protein